MTEKFKIIVRYDKDRIRENIFDDRKIFGIMLNQISRDITNDLIDGMS